MDITLTIPDTLYTDLITRSKAKNLPINEIIKIVLQQYVDLNESDHTRIINQGDIYWVTIAEKSDIPHPHVVVQENMFNHSRIETVVMCALTSNLGRASRQGNVLLDENEADLAKQSVVEVSKLSSIYKYQLGEYIGTLNEKRIEQILAGIKFLQSYYR